jgi:hypothetical protein
MATIQIPLIYDELLDFLLERATPEEILAFKASEKAEERAEYLLDGNNAGILSPEERIELQQMTYFDRKISVLKAQAAVTAKRKAS